MKLTATIFQSQLGQRLDEILVSLFPQYSRSCIQKWIKQKLVTINGTIIQKPKIKIKIQSKVIINGINENNNNETWQAQKLSVNIIYEDNSIIIINKSKNFVVHPGAGNLNGTVVNALLYYYPCLANVPRAGIVHRLDKDTTGLMIIAKTPLIYVKLLSLMKKRIIIRKYEAIVNGIMIAGGYIAKAIIRHPTRRTIMAIDTTENSKKAITHYRIIKRFRQHTHLAIQLETGVTHQIRVHLSYLNYSLVGDQKYQGRYNLPVKITKYSSFSKISKLYQFNRQALHASILQFPHPETGIFMEFYAAIPEDMKNIIHIFKKYI
ncbi:MAG: 23S rRNA pseudouridine(1911/1915/1917) synthase RluD [Candidatus Dasytiphilus stammeri]